MTSDDVRKLYWSEPFLPFELILEDGREVLVAKREQLTISAIGTRITVCPRIEEFEIIDLVSVKGVRATGQSAELSEIGAA